jgi:hypothetical protein
MTEVNSIIDQQVADQNMRAAEWPNIFVHDKAHWEEAAELMFATVPRHEWGKFVNWLAEEVGII